MVDYLANVRVLMDTANAIKHTDVSDNGEWIAATYWEYTQPYEGDMPVRQGYPVRINTVTNQVEILKDFPNCAGMTVDSDGTLFGGSPYTAAMSHYVFDLENKTTIPQTDYILSKYGEKYVPEKYNDYHSTAGAQDAHEAIRPISLDRTPEEMQKKLSRNHYRLYKLIYERFLASQMTEALYDTLTVRVAADCKSGDQYGFSLKGKSLKFDGYTAVYSQAQIQSKDEDDEEISLLPNLVEGENLSLIEYKYEQKFTKPPARYTDASLVKAMEENGIGRPSTYASIISVLNKRQYVEKENKCFKPTALGIVVVDTMNKYFEDIMDYKFTANMESILDKIEEGQIEWKKVISDFYPPLKEKLIIASNDGEKFKPEYEVSDVKCEKCGANMVVKSGRYGKFLACPNFPKCRNIKSLAEEVSKCPKCGKSIVKRRSKKGKIFYSCTGYPDCDFISWEIPAPIFCPKCNSTMYMKKTKEAVVYTCINKLCNYSETHPVEVGVKNDG